ncbi:MAG: DUF3192 domain-containing protein [Chlamydiota bacterium]
MKYLKGIVFISCFLSFASCSKSPIVLGTETDINLYHLSQLDLGMSSCQVRYVMGNPSMIKEVVVGDTTYEVWYYLTSPYRLEQIKPIRRNFTPVVFKNDAVDGFGYLYLKHLQGDKRFERNKAYYNTRPEIDNAELQREGHGFVPPPPYENVSPEALRDHTTTAQPKTDLEVEEILDEVESSSKQKGDHLKKTRSTPTENQQEPPEKPALSTPQSIEPSPQR